MDTAAEGAKLAPTGGEGPPPLREAWTLGEWLWWYSERVSIAGVAVAALGLLTGFDAMYFAGLVLALPAFLFYGAVAVVLALFFSAGAFATLVVLPGAAVVVAMSHLKALLRAVRRR